MRAEARPSRFGRFLLRAGLGFSSGLGSSGGGATTTGFGAGFFSFWPQPASSNAANSASDHLESRSVCINPVRLDESATKTKAGHLSKTGLCYNKLILRFFVPSAALGAPGLGHPSQARGCSAALHDAISALPRSVCYPNFFFVTLFLCVNRFVACRSYPAAIS